MGLLDPRTLLQDNSDLVLLCADEYCPEQEIRDKKLVYVKKYCETYHLGDCTHTAIAKLSKDAEVKKSVIMEELDWINLQRAREMIREGKIERRCYRFEE